MSDIFISYKREEQATARKLADALEREGWSVWWDPKLRAGEHFDDVIEKALTDAKCVIVLWSKLSIESRYVKDEASYALKRNKLVPVSIDDVEPPFRFEGLHTERLGSWDGSDTASEFQKLVADIAEIIGLPQSLRTDDAYSRTRVVAVPPEFVSPSSVDAIVSEEDTSLVLSAEAQLGDVKETHDQLINQAVDTEPHAPGTVVVKGGSPLRFLAVIHDLERDPSWREEWIASALANIFMEAEARELHSIVLPMLGTLHGLLNKRRFAKLLRNALEGTSLKHLEIVWLIVPTGADREILEDLGIFDIDIRQAEEEAREVQESSEKPIAIAHIQTGAQRGKSFILTEGTNNVTIGRSPDCDWVIDDPYISRSHCRLKIEPIGSSSISGAQYKFRLIDSGSSVGITVNGTRVEGAELRNSDYFELGGVRFRFELMDE